MSDQNPEDSFTFVDKRKTIDESDAPQTSPGEALVEEEISGNVPEEPAGDAMASFGLAAYVTGLIASDAWQKMGLIPDPSTGKVTLDLDQCRFSIDCVAAIIGVIDQNQDKVPAELRRDLQRVLSDLRLNFVEQTRRQSAAQN